jgi:DNA (cytosine-5)-methyltransferase 1
VARELSYISLFAGAGGFDLGFDAAGFRCVAQVEIDKTARSVLARHWPDVPRYEDVRAFGSAQVPYADVVVGGFPCQDVSFAGKRGGFEAGVRSSLWFEMVRVIRELRPVSVVWENVPGLLSADEGRAFGWVLRELADLGFDGGWGDLDARFFGVPQSRQRVFGVFFRGHPGARGAGEVLALAPGLRRHPAAGGEAGAGTPAAPGGGAAAAGGFACFGGNDTRGERGGNPALSAKGGTGRLDFETETFVVFNPQAAGKQTTLGTRSDGLTGALGTGQVPAVAYRCHGSNVGPAGTVGGGVPFVIRTAQTGADGITPALTAADSNRTRNQMVPGPEGYVVRRLTPRECELLMGWPPDWTRWRADGTEIKDGPRYRMAGNGVVGTVARWLAVRLMAALRGGV